MLVETVIPVALPAFGAPIVTPPRVTEMLLGGMGLMPTVRMTELEPVAALVNVLVPVVTGVGVTPDAKKSTG